MTEEKNDKTISCEECGMEFAFTAGEQEFYAKKKLPDPQYCLICRGKFQAMKKDANKYGREERI